MCFLIVFDVCELLVFFRFVVCLTVCGLSSVCFICFCVLLGGGGCALGFVLLQLLLLSLRF